MDTTQLAAAVTLLQSAKSVAIFPVSVEDIDAAASSLALTQALKNRGIEVHFFAGAALPKMLSFLSGSDLVEKDFSPRGELTIRIPTEKTAAEGLTYWRDEKALEINVAARQGIWSSRDIQIQNQWHSPADVLVVVGAPRLALLGPRFTKNPEIFYQTPLLSISHQVEAENFGKVNLHDRAVGSCAEIIAGLLLHWDKAILSAPVATALQAALMFATESFQKSMTSPAQFDLAALLLEAGAERTAVVRHLYKTRPLGSLKLWGQVLSHLNTTVTANGTRIATATLGASDLAKTGAKLEAVHELLSTILVHAPDVDLVAILVQQGSRVATFIASAHQEALMIAHRLGSASGSAKIARVDLVASSLEQARLQVIQMCDSVYSARYTATEYNKGGATPISTQPDPQRTSHSQEVSGRQTSPTHPAGRR